MADSIVKNFEPNQIEKLSNTFYLFLGCMNIFKVPFWSFSNIYCEEKKQGKYTIYHFLKACLSCITHERDIDIKTAPLFTLVLYYKSVIVINLLNS